MSRRNPEAEEGAVLVVVIAFMAFFAIVIGAVLGFVETGLMTTVRIRDQGHDLYSADGAMNAAISQIDHRVLLDGAAHTFATFDDPDSCPVFVVPDLNGNSLTIECEIQDDSRDFIPGGEGGVDPLNTPAQALLVLGGVSGDGLRISGNSPYPYRVQGDVAANVTLTGPTTADGTFEVDGNVAATACSGSIEVVGDGHTLDCAGGGAFTDPGYASESTATLIDVPVLPVCAPVILMPPGIYRDGAALTSLIRKCNAEFRFEGTYYFEFTSGCNGGNVWCINNKDAKIVGGTPLYEDLTQPDRITSCSPIGAQFIFGGDSRIDVQAGEVRLCPTQHADEQRIAIYAKSPEEAASDPVSDTTTIEATLATSVAQGQNPAFANPNDARAIDEDPVDVATATVPSKRSSTLTLSSFSGLPAGAVVDALRVRVRHAQSAPADVSNVSVTLRPATGPSITVLNQDSPCPASVCSTTLVEQTYAVNPTPTATQLAGMSVEYTVKRSNDAGPDLVATLDGIEIDVDYTVPASAPLGTQSGCVVTGGCDLVTASGPDTTFQVLGTIYVPNSSLDLFTNNRGVEQSYRGIIARSVTLRLNPSVPTDPGVAISIPSTEGGIDGIKPAHVVLKAVLDGVERLVADIYVDDELTAVEAVSVDRWQVRR